MPGSVKYIVVHHTATSSDTEVEAIRKHHRAQGWKDIGYHHLIRRPDGTQLVEHYAGRMHNLDDDWEPWEYGAHILGLNDRAIGVALVGNYHRTSPHPAMLDGLVRICAMYCDNFGLGADAVKGHYELASNHTVCPGRFLPMTRVRELVAERLSRGEAHA